MDIPEVVAVMDSTKIQDYLECPRRFFFSRVLGWQPELTSVHLVFGSAWHEAMEFLAQNGHTLENVTPAFDKFMEIYRASFPPEMDSSNSPKTPTNALRALIKYVEVYPEPRDYDVLHTEVAGCVSIGGFDIHFKMDTVCHGEVGYFSHEHKTSKYFNKQWADQWRQSIQIGTYSHTLYCMYPEREVFGVYVNGAFIVDPPRIKKDGTPYEGSKDIEFQRLPARRTMASMQDWLETVTFWLECVDRDFAKLSECNESDPVLTAFHKNPKQCTNYGACPYLDHCVVQRNPLAHVNDIPLGMRVDHWDPRKQRDGAQKVVDL